MVQLSRNVSLFLMTGKDVSYRGPLLTLRASRGLVGLWLLARILAVLSTLPDSTNELECKCLSARPITGQGDEHY